MLTQNLKTDVQVNWKYIGLNISLNKTINIIDKKSVAVENFIATINFKAVDNDGKDLPDIPKKIIVKTGKDFNDWWKNFKSGSYNYEILANELGIEAPKENESEFLNP